MMSEFDEIIEIFDLLGDWEARYEYLIELGEQLSVMPEGEKTDANRVKPCMSTVHVMALPDEEDADHIQFVGDCDTAIIKGVLALLIQVMSGRSPREIIDLDIDQLFTGLRLYEHLSPARHVGIYAIVEQMKSEASHFISDTV